MKVYNSNFLKNKQRFPRAVIVGILASIGCAFLIAIYEKINPIPLSFTPFLYILSAYGISSAIKEYGRGVEAKYSYVGIACMVLCVLLSRFFWIIMMTGFELSFLGYYLNIALRSFFAMDINGIIDLACIAYAIYIAYYNSRIV